jgi:hypothetical protein
LSFRAGAFDYSAASVAAKAATASARAIAFFILFLCYEINFA